MSEEFLTVYDVAERLSVNQQTVRNWIDRGELQAIRAGRCVRVPLDAFKDLVGSHSRAASTPERARGDLLPVGEVAQKLGMAEKTVRGWIARGDLPTVRLGVKAVRVKQEDLDAFLQARLDPPSEAAEELASSERSIDFEQTADALKHVAEEIWPAPRDSVRPL